MFHMVHLKHWFRSEPVILQIKLEIINKYKQNMWDSHALGCLIVLGYLCQTLQ